jgi:hypothetical protein
MVSYRVTEEFKLEATKQITERHFPVSEMKHGSVPQPTIFMHE